MSCSSFAKAAGATWEEKAEEACTNCRRCNGNFPINPDEEEDGSDSGDFDFILAEIAELAANNRAGFRVDFASIDYVRGSLFIEWDKAENEIQNLWRIREQVFYKAHFKEG